MEPELGIPYLASVDLTSGLRCSGIMTMCLVSWVFLEDYKVANVGEPLRQMSNRMQAKKQWDKRNQRGREGEKEREGLL